MRSSSLCGASSPEPGIYRVLVAARIRILSTVEREGEDCHTRAATWLAGSNNEVMSISGALNRPRRNFGGTTASAASSFSDG
jgi:hypothetical protein